MSRKRYTILAKAYDKKGRILGVGINDYNKSNRFFAEVAKSLGLDEKIYIHAECSAILRAKDKNIHRLTVERYNNDGSPALAKPCVICRRIIEMFAISVLEYTTTDGWVKEKLK